MTLQQKFNEYIASGDITISDEQRDWILPFIERCVGEERRKIAEVVGDNSVVLNGAIYVRSSVLLQSLTQEDKIK